MLFNALAALGHRGIKTTATFGRAGLMLFNAVVGKPEFRKHAPLMEYIADNRIHALSIKAFTPQEWARDRKLNGF